MWLLIISYKSNKKATIFLAISLNFITQKLATTLNLFFFKLQDKGPRDSNLEKRGGWGGGVW